MKGRTDEQKSGDDVSGFLGDEDLMMEGGFWLDVGGIVRRLVVLSHYASKSGLLATHYESKLESISLKKTNHTYIWAETTNMKIVFKALIFVSLFAVVSLCHGQRVKWSQTMGGKYWEAVLHHTNDNSGNVICTGYFYDTLYFQDSQTKFTPSKLKPSQIFIASYSPQGELNWARHLVGSGNSRPTSIQLDSKNNIYVYGNFEDTVDFDPGPKEFKIVQSQRGRSHSEREDLFMLKLSSSGDFIWVKSIDHAHAQDFVIKNNRLICAGGWEWTTDFNPDPNVSKRATATDTITGNPFVLELDTSGKYVAFRQFDIPGRCRQVSPADSGNFFVGLGYGKGDLDPGSGKFEVKTGWNHIVVLDSSLNFRKAFTGYGGIIHALPSGEFYSLRQFSRKFDLDPGPDSFFVTTNGSFAGASITKFNSKGEFLWGKQLGPSTTITHGLDVVADVNDNPYVVGYTYSAQQFTPIEPTQVRPSYGFSAYICSFNKSGKLVWTTFLGGGLDDVAKGRTVTLKGEDTLIISGEYAQNCYYHHQRNRDTLIGYGKYSSDPFHYVDGFIYNVPVCKTDTLIRSIRTCDSLRFPNTDSIVYLSGTYNIDYQNIKDCDSIVRYNVLITNSSNTQQSLRTCDSFHLNQHWVRNSGLYYDTLVNAGGCDSIIELELQISQSKDTSLLISECDSFTLNGKKIRHSVSLIDSLYTSQGCDSMVSWLVTINSSFDSIYSYSGCDSILVNATWYYKSQTVVDSLTTVKGCDSVLVHRIILNNSIETVQYDTACEVYKLASGKILDSSGVYRFNHLSSAGCDSTITLNLEVKHIDTTVSRNGDTLFALDENSSYRWLNCDKGYMIVPSQKKNFFVAKQRERFAVELSNWKCKDTSSCYLAGPLTIRQVTPSKMYLTPNPNNGRFVIQSDKTIIDAKVRIHTLDGRQIAAKTKHENNQIQVDFNAPPGTYICNLEQKAGSFFFRIIRE